MSLNFVFIKYLSKGHKQDLFWSNEGLLLSLSPPTHILNLTTLSALYANERQPYTEYSTYAHKCVCVWLKASVYGTVGAVI